MILLSKTWPLLGLSVALLMAPLAARAQDAGGLQPICADRPTKANGPCTVDVGHVQLEADLANASFQHAGGVTTDVWLIANPTLKLGLARHLDIEASFDPVEVVRVKAASGQVVRQTGVGDLFVKVKYAFLDRPSVQAALIPYVKAPTARTPLIGDGAWEGGLVAPVNVRLSGPLSVTVQPEFDALANAAGGGHHLAFSQDAAVALSLPHDVTVFGELWGQWDFDPAGTGRQYSADIAAALGLGRDSQLDAGINFGLNRQTPGVAPYIGYSHRF